MDATTEQRQAFGRAIRQRLEDQRRSRAWLGAEVARIELGPDARPYTSSAVTMWVNGDTEPTRPKVWAIEQALGTRAGTLSRLLGYLPVDAQPVATVEEAVAADPRLGEDARRILLAVYLTVADS